MSSSLADVLVTRASPAVRDLVAEIAAAIAVEVPDLDFDDALDMLLAGEVDLRAIGPSGRLWGVIETEGSRVGVTNAIVSFVVDSGFGLVAKPSSSVRWIHVRALDPAVPR